jgi:hypothetical protein
MIVEKKDVLRNDCGVDRLIGWKWCPLDCPLNRDFCTHCDFLLKSEQVDDPHCVEGYDSRGLPSLEEEWQERILCNAPNTAWFMVEEDD